MVKSVKFLKLPFYKNDGPGGAQAVAIKNCPDDCVVIHSQTVKMGRLWGYATPNQLLSLLSKNHGLYEMMTKYPQKMHLDIDKHDSPENAGMPYLEKVKEILNEFFPDAEYAVSGSVTEKKTSFHLTLSTTTKNATT
jgi:hypothetical protein